GEAIALGQVEHPSPRRVETDAVPDRDVDRMDAVLRAQREADLFAGVEDRRGAPAVMAERCVRADEQGLRATDRRQVEEDAEMTGQPEAPRVGAALTVADDEV